MVNPCPSGFCLTWHFSDVYDGNENATHPVCYRKRPIYDVGFRPNGTVFEFLTGESAWGWESGYVNSVNSEGVYGTLSAYHNTLKYLAAPGDYFTIDPATRAACFSPQSASPSPSLGGNASPPPPPGKNMCGCDCNTIATIVEDKIYGLDEGIKSHIDQRTIEELKAVNKMLQGMQMNLDLKPVIDRLNQVEANLWNGVGR